MKSSVLLMVALAAFFYATPAATQTEGQVYENSCGRVGDALAVLEQYFAQYAPRKAELNRSAAENYLAHHGIDGDGVSVFIFQSHYFPKYAVVAAKAVGDILCIVRIKGRVHQEYSPDDLHEILNTNGSV